eukprot:UN24441
MMYTNQLDIKQRFNFSSSSVIKSFILTHLDEKWKILAFFLTATKT